MTAKPLIVGRIGGPHGVRGWSVLTSLTDPAENLLGYSPLLLASGGQWRPLESVEFSRSGKKLLIRFNGNTDRDVAEGLRGVEIGLAAENLPPPESGEFYWRDLIGLTAVDHQGRSLGKVLKLLPTPAHDVLVIAPFVAPAATDEPGEVLVPFVEAFTGTVDMVGGTIQVDWPELSAAPVSGDVASAPPEPTGS